MSFAKGGSFSNFYSDLHLLVDWDDGRQTYRGFVGTSHRPLERPASSNHFFRPGITWPSRADGLCFRLLPANAVFSGKGPALFCDCDDSQNILATCGILSSAVFNALIAIQIGRVSLAQSYEVGLIQQTPFPELREMDAASLRRAVLEAWRTKRARDSVVSTAHSFALPAALTGGGETIAERAVSWAAHGRSSEDSVAAIQAEIDDISFRVYDLDVADRAALTSTPVTESTGDAEAQAGEDEEEETATSDPASLAADLLAYVHGVAFGRWDIRYATGEQAAPELPDPFAPLPVCPPGQLQNAEGLPASPEDVPATYPIKDIPWDGILVDDANHPLDIERRVREVMEIIWTGKEGGPTAEAIELEACEILGVKTLRDYFRKPANFFADHLKRYSKSRRQAPIYWPLSTKSGSYTLWIYYHRLNDQTLHKCLADFLDPKIKDVENELGKLTGKDSGRAADLRDFLNELKDLKDEIERVIKLPWKPNLNDGVLITASPLGKLFRLSKWQKDLKACWEELEKGDYDWAHLAYTIWPERVEKVCEKDRSIAIAHGLEHLCKIEPPKPKKPRGKKASS